MLFSFPMNNPNTGHIMTPLTRRFIGQDCGTVHCPYEGTKQVSGNRRRAILGGSSKNTRDSWQSLSQSCSQTSFLLSFFAGHYHLFFFLSFSLFLPFPSLIIMPLEGVGAFPAAGSSLGKQFLNCLRTRETSYPLLTQTAKRG